MLKALVLVAVSTTAFADQCEVVTAAQAKAAVKLLKKGTAFVEFCEPCGDSKVPAPSTVSTVKISKFDETMKEVEVNGKGVDLAYTYVKVKGVFTNVAALAKCKAEGVSQTVAVAEEASEK